ncbi:PAS domain-containing protein [Amycolatopsis benzoatilytica]|uniref:PAS domain-containing protein n=1 Tax=Amycolatopsis benzoatilytica TaxID=346045 RepID=UPI0006872DE6|nr:PAS domain-containing protein [Amycolatopsis benzoatilytica]
MNSTTVVTRYAVPVPPVRTEYGDRYRSLFDESGMCMANLDLGLRVTDANRFFSRQFGRSGQDLRGRGFCEFLHSSAHDKVRRQLSLLRDGGHPRFAEQVVAMGARQAVFAGELTGMAVRGEAGRVNGLLVVVRPDEAEGALQLASGKQVLLSPIDARVLEGVATGESTVQLAAKLFLSRGGVEYHVTTLLRQLKVTNRPALVSKSYSLGILSLGQWPPRVRPEHIRAS